ncbi:MAG TPA: ATP-binding protein [Terriglobales bacterium]|nr:ATP-binding protein [Terriglobales bacterium]
MSFRRRLLAVFAVIIVATVVAIGWAISRQTRQLFERTDNQRTEALVQQFRREFQRRGDEVAKRVQNIAENESIARMALDISHGGDPAAYLNEATNQARAYGLDFLEILSADGSIISSAQWPARFGYKETVPSKTSAQAFLKREELQDGTALGLFSVRAIRVGENPIYILGGERLDREFLFSLSLPPGMRAFLYRVQDGSFNAANLVGADPDTPNLEKLSSVIDEVKLSRNETSRIIHWSSDLRDAETFKAFPLKGQDDSLLAVLLIGHARRDLVQFLYDIRTVAFTVGGAGILFAILISLWLAARFTRPVEQLAEGARAVAAGNWDTRVEVPNTDELGELAEAFNSMTHEIISQREKLLQSERVAAWRELARRLAHELKNPLFPLQITVENLVRARELPPAEFDEVFRESASTLLAELTNLKTIIGRFSDFSKMPQPQLQRVQINDVIKGVVALHEPQFSAPGKPQITVRLELQDSLRLIEADPDLLHRALSNLVLNAMDAMPNGGTITFRTREQTDSVRIEIADSGTGLTPEECVRLFTPYYTSKQRGTGLGLAIVQSVISDHKGTITVESTPGQGATFRIELPKYSSGTVKADTAKVG